MPPAIRFAAILAVAIAAPFVVTEARQKAASNGAQTQRFPQFDNDKVKVWKTVIQPHQPLAMHHHDHPRVIIALTGGTVNIVDPAGTIEPHVWETGKAYWLPAMPPNTLHSDANAGDNPIEVMVVELQKES